MTSRHSKHRNTLHISAAEMQKISQDINLRYSLSEPQDSNELSLQAIDPRHLYAHWSIHEKLDTDNKLVLRVYWQPDELQDISQSKLWFDIELDQTHGMRNIKLPIDGSRYCAILGKRDRHHNFKIIIRAETIEVPSATAKQVDQQAQNADQIIDFAHWQQSKLPFSDKITRVKTKLQYDEIIIHQYIKQQIIAAHKPTQASTRKHTGHFDETVIDVLIRQTLSEKGIEFEAMTIRPKDIDSTSHYAASNASGQNNLL